MEHQGRHGLRQRIFAWVYSQGDSGDKNPLVVAHRQKLLGTLSGSVLELGPGTGANFAYFPRGMRWTGIEPNLFMHDRLKAEAQRHGFTDIDIRASTAERLDVPDQSMDAVVCTLVLCSVSDPALALREILRVLKPGGRFVFLEHVAAPRGTRLRWVQSLIQPAWSFFGDGCHPDRETWAVIENAGFAQVEIEHFDTPYGIVAPAVAGWAVK